MATETITQINQPAPFIEAAAKPFLQELTSAVGDFKGQDLTKLFGPQFVAGPGALQTQAEQLASGLGGFQPFLQTAAASTGPSAYQAFMSPFQKDVIDTTLTEFDRQTAAGIPALKAQAIQAGAFGGGREAAQQNFANQMNLAQATPALLGQQIGALSTLGAQQQAQQQAQLSAQQQQAQAVANQPLQAAQTLGSGIMGLISGYPGGTQTQMQPTPSPLQTALSAGATLAGIYRALD